MTHIPILLCCFIGWFVDAERTLTEAHRSDDLYVTCSIDMNPPNAPRVWKLKFFVHSVLKFILAVPVPTCTWRICRVGEPCGGALPQLSAGLQSAGSGSGAALQLPPPETVQHAVLSPGLCRTQWTWATDSKAYLKKTKGFSFFSKVRMAPALVCLLRIMYLCQGSI